MMKKESCCGYQDNCDYESECVRLKEELDLMCKRLDESCHIINELRKENETLKVAYDEQREELIRCEAQIEAFKFVISNGR